MEEQNDPTKNIVIVGGGSSGWMTASILIKFFPEKNITLIEDPEQGVIGVGESTYDGIRYFCGLLEIDDRDFFSYTDASIKLGLRLSNFHNNHSSDSYIYPFGPPNTDGTLWGLDDWQVKKHFFPETPAEQYAESYFPAAIMCKYNRINDNFDYLLDKFNILYHTALHFDAVKFGQWLKNKYSMPKGVKCLQDKVVKCEMNNDGSIKNLYLKSGVLIEADLFIDCSGFSSLLLSNYMKEPFNDYTNLLPNNKAWATRIPYKDKEKEMRNVTTSTAIENGWCWDIPLWSRLGAGYVYSDKFIDDEQALLEFKNYLMSNKIVCPRNKIEIDDLEFKNIKMRVGIHERVWVKNVVAIGLAAGFIEPLESNGLFTVHDFLYQLCHVLSRKSKITEWDRESFNTATKKIYNTFVEFIRLHYALSSRTDTKYWEYLSQQQWGIGNSKFHLLQAHESRTTPLPASQSGGLNWISSGMSYSSLDAISIRLGEMYNRFDYKTELKKYWDNLENRRIKWESEILNSLTTMQYIENKYHS